MGYMCAKIVTGFAVCYTFNVRITLSDRPGYGAHINHYIAFTGRTGFLILAY